MTTYTVFSRTPWRRVDGRYVPHGGAKRRKIRTGLTWDEAVKLCEKGPANIARENGREYRGKNFYEFTADENY